MFDFSQEGRGQRVILDPSTGGVASGDGSDPEDPGPHDRQSLP
jgi:hypothetical protein